MANKSIKQRIPKIYKRQWLEAVLFGWIRANKTIIPSITIEQAVESFYKDQDITEYDYPMSDCISTYQRMTREFYKGKSDV